MMENQVNLDERDISNSSVERIVLPLVTSLVSYMIVSMRVDITNNLNINKDEIENKVKFIWNNDGSARLLYILQRAGMPRNAAYKICKSVSMSGGRIETLFASTSVLKLIEMGKISEEEIRDCIN